MGVKNIEMTKFDLVLVDCYHNDIWLHGRFEVLPPDI